MNLGYTQVCGKEADMGIGMLKNPKIHKNDPEQ